MRMVDVYRAMMCSCLIPSVLAGCGGIAEDTASAEPQLLHYQLGEVAEITVGGEESGPSADLFQVRGAVRFDDGRVLIGDGGHRILRFDADGEYLGTFGREGRGPGEFGSIIWMRRTSADTLAVYDGLGNRITILTADGELVETFLTRSGVGMFADGSIAGRISLPQPPSSRVEVLQRFPFEVVRLSRTGQVLNSIAVVPGNERMETEEVPGMGWFQLPRTSYAVGPDVLYVATGEEFEVQVFSPDGGSATIWTADIPRVPLTPDEAFRQFSRYQAVSRRAFDRFPTDRSLPAITGMLLADNGELWVQGTIVNEMDDPTRQWYMFAPDGQLRGEALIPSWFRPLQIGDDFVLGVSRDDLNVERVELRSWTVSE